MQEVTPGRRNDMSAERVRSYLMEHGIRYRTHEHVQAFTSEEVAAVDHIAGDEFAKPVLLIADGALVMAVLPASRRVDLQKAQMALGAESIRLADEKEFAPAFPDCERGAEPPLGSLYGVPTLIDLRFDHEEVTFNAGTHTETITMALAEYMTVTKAQVVDLAVDR
jgi:Ala-tRNA(Pro) deacylase